MDAPIEVVKAMLTIDLEFMIRTMRQIGEKLDKYMETADKIFVEEAKILLGHSEPSKENIISSTKEFLFKVEKIILKANEYEKSPEQEELLRQSHEQVINLRQYIISQTSPDSCPTQESMIRLMLNNLLAMSYGKLQ